MWYDHCRTLFNSVHSSCDINADFIHTHCDFVNCEVYLISNMAADHIGIQLDHYRYASSKFVVILSMCFSSIYCHGYMPKGPAHSVISPVVKDKSGDTSDSANYHPIALHGYYFL